MIGSGGHARVLQETLSQVGFELEGFVAPTAEGSQLVDDIEWIGDDSSALDLNASEVILVNGIGSAGSTAIRSSVFAKYKNAGFNSLQVTSAESTISDSAVLVEGVQVLPGAIVHTDAFVDDNSIINTGAIVEHHTKIGASCHVATGAVLCGGVTVGNETHIGAGATVIQGVTIGAKCIIGAGAVVITDVPDGHTAIGVPATVRPNKA